MNKKLLIIISGLPCTGKSTLAKELSKKYKLPIISKDTIKESLFDSLGYSDREFSRKIGGASYNLMYELVEELLSNEISLIAETNFNANFANKIFRDIISKHKPQTIQVVCKTDGEILFERFKNRSESGNRHPGHVDHNNYDEFEDALKSGEYTPLDIDGETLEVNTTDFSQIDYFSIYNTIDRLNTY